jgi:hypothetical protein
MSFIRFKPINYILENQDECLPDDAIDAVCVRAEEEYVIPAKPNDEINWIVNKDEVDPLGAQVSELRIGLVHCGMLVDGAENIGTIFEADGQYFCSVIIPLNIPDCIYNFVIYNINNPIDCGQFKGFTLQQVIDSSVTLAQVLNCTLENFIP